LNLKANITKPRVLVILSGYPCARSPWGNSENHGTPDISSFDSFFAGAEYLRKLLKGNSVDYICTTWDGVGEDQIQQTYKPKIYKSYSQDRFLNQVDGKLKSYEADRMRRRSKFYSNKRIENDLVVSSIRFASQLQSRCDAAKLALELIRKTSNVYDAILLTRYDISTRGGFLVRHPTYLDNHDLSFLGSSIDSPRFILPSFSQLNCGFPDMWFYMNLAALKHYSLIVDHYLTDITSNSSEYCKLMTKGWPFSQFFPMASIYDYRQYSNEIFKRNKSSLLMIYPDWEVSNLHCYHKYYMYLSNILPHGRDIKFKNWFKILMAFWACSILSSNKKLLFFEVLSYLNASAKILTTRITFKFRG
jgi:hypothetical protein